MTKAQSRRALRKFLHLIELHKMGASCFGLACRHPLVSKVL